MRLFVAINFSPEIKAALLRAQARLRSLCAGGNFSRPENLHLTLAFIGETERLSDAREAVAECGGPFELSLSGLGRFGELYWCGIAENPRLTALARELRDALTRRGFKLEAREFSPHITIARRVRADGSVDFDVPPASMTVGRISLMSSERINGKLTYTEVYARRL